jgi:crossover junction endodeoxyribonuclease RuvC
LLVLGLDPGSRHTGYGLVAVEGDQLRAVDYGRVSCRAGQPLPERLALLSRELEALLERFRPAAAALETPFHGLNSRSLIVLSQARGALLAALAGRSIEIREYSPAEVKVAVSGNGRADKQQVARMVRLLLTLPQGNVSPDATDALAVAICCVHRLRMDRMVASRRRE